MHVLAWFHERAEDPADEPADHGTKEGDDEDLAAECSAQMAERKETQGADEHLVRRSQNRTDRTGDDADHYVVDAQDHLPEIRAAARGFIPVKTRSLANRAEFDAYARDFSRRLRPGDVVALSGDLGAGKTAFVSAAAAGLGVEDDVSSPTFVFRQRYGGPVPVEHLDLYRIEDTSELRELGLEDAFNGEAVVFVEWPERAPALLPSNAISLRITGAGDEPRTIIFETRP